jgi:hypothetical protein
VNGTRWSCSVASTPRAAMTLNGSSPCVSKAGANSWNKCKSSFFVWSWSVDWGSIRVYPQLRTQWPPAVDLWAPFLRRLYQSKEYAGHKTVLDLINHCLRCVIAVSPALPSNVNEPWSQHDIMAIIYLCLDTEQVALCATVAQKMQDAVDPGAYDTQLPPWHWSVEITSALEMYLDADPARSALALGLVPFFENTVVSVLSPRGLLVNGRLQFQRPTRDVLAALMKAAKRLDGGASFISQL